jgi:hypothetical protein
LLAVAVLSLASNTSFAIILALMSDSIAIIWCT